MKDVIAPNIRGLVRRAWSEGQAIDLHGIGYGRIHWGNERDIHAEPFPYYHFLAGLVSAMGVRTVAPCSASAFRGQNDRRSHDQGPRSDL